MGGNDNGRERGVPGINTQYTQPCGSPTYSRKKNDLVTGQDVESNIIVTIVVLKMGDIPVCLNADGKDSVQKDTACLLYMDTTCHLIYSCPSEG